MTFTLGPSLSTVNCWVLLPVRPELSYGVITRETVPLIFSRESGGSFQYPSVFVLFSVNVTACSQVFVVGRSFPASFVAFVDLYAFQIVSSGFLITTVMPAIPLASVAFILRVTVERFVPPAI